MQWMTPVGRGFDSSFGFLGGSEDHFEHTTGGSLFGCPSRAVDLFRSNTSGAEWCVGNVGEPHCNGTHGAYLFNAETQSIISEHDVATPLFLYVATQDAHGCVMSTTCYLETCVRWQLASWLTWPVLLRPDQITAKYSQLFNSSFTPAYGIYNGMVAAADDLYGNMTKKLREKQMYERTIIILSADNGGPASIYASSHAANNWPLRGGKKT